MRGSLPRKPGPILGARQSFPKQCGGCEMPFDVGDPITMLPVLCEGDVVSVGRWPSLTGEFAPANFGGRVLWATWLCMGCASLRPGVVAEEVEPAEARRARQAADRQLGRSAVAKGREEAVQRLRALRYR